MFFFFRINMKNNNNNSNNPGLFIRKAENSDEWECGYMVSNRKSRNSISYSREIEQTVPSYELAEQWLNEQGLKNVS